ncbi:putative Gibberellin 20 oxidase [Corchorus olitorius]|uniref:Gibberellin 20 oxidase n=1 Tax=Corchorus olitorius TaxID=93759 RepID=A0A1R3JLS8_9ROSI|nr:putative Gibberellin 20 oxidase [Corchorus olitorius]
MAAESAMKLPVIDLFGRNLKSGTTAWVSKCSEDQVFNFVQELSIF